MGATFVPTIASVNSWMKRGRVDEFKRFSANFAGIRKILGIVKVRTTGPTARSFLKHQVTCTFRKSPGILMVRKVGKLWDKVGGSWEGDFPHLDQATIRWMKPDETTTTNMRGKQIYDFLVFHTDTWSLILYNKCPTILSFKEFSQTLRILYYQVNWEKAKLMDKNGLPWPSMLLQLSNQESTAYKSNTKR